MVNLFTDIIRRSVRIPKLSALNLLLQDAFEGDGISSELRYSLPKLLDCHLFLVEVEPELRFIVDVGALGDVEAAGVARYQLLRNLILRVVEVFQKVGLWRISCRP